MLHWCTCRRASWACGGVVFAMVFNPQSVSSLQDSPADSIACMCIEHGSLAQQSSHVILAVSHAVQVLTHWLPCCGMPCAYYCGARICRAVGAQGSSCCWCCSWRRGAAAVC
jgi:hypothetical protein